MTHIHAILQALGFNLVVLVLAALILLVGGIIGACIGVAVTSPDPLPDERSVYKDLCRVRDDLRKMEKERDSFKEKLFAARQGTSLRMPHGDTLSEWYAPHIFSDLSVQERFNLPGFEEAANACGITKSNYDMSRWNGPQNCAILRHLKNPELPETKEWFPPAHKLYFGLDMSMPGADHSAMCIIKKVQDMTADIVREPADPKPEQGKGRKPQNSTDKLILATENQYKEIHTKLEAEELHALGEIRAQGVNVGIKGTIKTRFEIEKK